MDTPNETPARPGRAPRTLATALVAAALGLGLALAPLGAARAGGGVVTATASGKFNTVVTSLKREIAKHRLVVVKEVPYQKMLAMVSTKAEPMIGLEVFHPRFGKVIYAKEVNAFMDVPLRLLVRAAGAGKIEIRYRKPSAVFAPYPGLAELGKTLDGLLGDILARVAK